MLNSSGIFIVLAGTHHSGPGSILILLAVLNWLAYIEIQTSSICLRDKLNGEVKYKTLNRSLFWFTVLGGGFGAIIGAIRFKIYLNKLVFWIWSILGSAICVLLSWLTIVYLILPQL